MDRITDPGAAGAPAALGSAFNVQPNKQAASGYEKIGQVDGRMFSGEYDSAARRGRCSVLAASRFMVEAEGSGVDAAALKSGVAAIGYDRLEALAR